mmetsp:Transcript_24988/g.59491  ORF Transcript_24988/g.59491 Transcript_24988/m.59491 type:complete len:444 (-) Transcript_24988:978-2309(-)
MPCHRPIGQLSTKQLVLKKFTRTPQLSLLASVSSGKKLLVPLPSTDGFGVLLCSLVVRQLMRNELLACLQQVLEVKVQVCVCSCKETDSYALLASAPRAADAVGVGLDGSRHVVVHNNGYILHVNTTPSDIRGHQNVVLAILEAIKRDLAQVLGLAAMKDTAHVARLLQRPRDRVAVGARVDKHDRAPLVSLVERVLEQAELLLVEAGALPGEHLDMLRHVVCGAARGADLHDDRAAEVLPRDALHRGGHCGREHVSRAVDLVAFQPDVIALRLEVRRGHGVHDTENLRLKAHVEHAVRLVEDQIGRPLAGARLHLDEVDEPPGGADRHVRAGLQVLELLVLAEPAEGRDAAEAVRLAELPCLLVYLLRELARRGDDDPDGALPFLKLRLVHDVHQHRQHKRCRLPRARLGDAQDVAAGEHRWDGLSLDRRWGGVPLLVDGTH